MSTKANPGFDDYGALGQNEPFFVMMARRPGDAVFVRMWAAEQRDLGENNPRIDDAFKTADEMDAWRDAHIKQSNADEVMLQACRQIHNQLHPTTSFQSCVEAICLMRKRALQEIAILKQ